MTWFRPFQTPRLALALQGGGAHGAFTWGVLDALLERGIVPVAASGASAGAVNAIALAQGLLDGGVDGARAALARVWTAIGSHMPDGWFIDSDPPGPAPLLALWLHWAKLLSPYELNPLGINPLREILTEQIDVPRLRATPGLALFIATTHAASGRLRLFERAELSLDAIMASTCLPTLQQAVMIDGEPYWDGGYAANPPLTPLVTGSDADDLLIVTLNPRVHGPLPRTVPEIQARAVEIAFNAAFLREASILGEWQAAARRSRWPRSGLERRLAALQLHVIDADDALGGLPGRTRMVAHLPFLERLRDLGRERLQRWWAERGRREGNDLTAWFSTSHATGSAPPAA